MASNYYHGKLRVNNLIVNDSHEWEYQCYYKKKKNKLDDLSLVGVRGGLPYKKKGSERSFSLLGYN